MGMVVMCGGGSSRNNRMWWYCTVLWAMAVVLKIKIQERNIVDDLFTTACFLLGSERSIKK
jgi:hypothetical protein